MIYLKYCEELLKKPVGGSCSPFTGKEVGWGNPSLPDVEALGETGFFGVSQSC